MRIFSNFDTRLKKSAYNKWKLEFGEEKVLLLSKSKLFRFLKVDLPMFLFWGVSIVLLFYLNKRFGKTVFFVGGVIVLILGIFVIMPRIIKAIIDYNMDFVIITPKQLLRYDQEGVIQRNLVAINVESIKSITIKKRGLLYSLFDNGNIVFLTEGDTNYGEVTLDYIKDPEIKKLEVLKIIRI